MRRVARRLHDEAREIEPARQFAARQLGAVFPDDESRSALARLAAAGGPLAVEARTALAKFGRPLPDEPAPPDPPRDAG